MRVVSPALALVAALFCSMAEAHGPQIQITNDNNKITTRRLVRDGPYSNSLTPTTSVYVMPLLPFDSVWYSRPNNEVDPITQLPAFPSGPGLAYGYDLADGGTQAFAAESILSIGFTDGFKLWDGAAFVDAGATQLKAFRGSNPNIASSAGELRRHVRQRTIRQHIAPGSCGWLWLRRSGGAQFHQVRIVGRRLVAHKQQSGRRLHAQPSTLQHTGWPVAVRPLLLRVAQECITSAIADAVQSLGFASSAVQYVPEPSSLILLAVGAGFMLTSRRNNFYNWRH